MAYTAINIEGGMFPPDLLDEIGAGEVADGQKPSDFGLSGNRRITDEIQSAFSGSRVFWDAFQRRLARSNQNTTTLTRQNWMVPLMGDLLAFNQLRARRAAPIRCVRRLLTGTTGLRPYLESSLLNLYHENLKLQPAISGGALRNRREGH